MCFCAFVKRKNLLCLCASVKRKNPYVLLSKKKLMCFCLGKSFCLSKSGGNKNRRRSGAGVRDAAE